MSGARPWILLSSSSGETFGALWSQISESSKNSFKGYFADRPSKGLDVAASLLPQEKIFSFERSSFESQLISKRDEWADDLVVVLCGYKSILSASFLENLRAPVINLHPSLLPSFAGLDHSVHKEAFKKVTVSGFTLHLVDDSVDGGPILYQHPVYWGDLNCWEDGRARVRQAEQRYFGGLVEDVLQSKLCAEDRFKSSRELQSKVSWSKITFCSQPVIERQ